MTRLWHIAWSASLLTAAAVAAVWIACGWCSYVYQRSVRGELDRAVYVEQGHLYLLWAQPGATSQLHVPARDGWLPEEHGQWWGRAATPAREPKWSALGAAYAPATKAGDLNWFVVRLLWPLLALLVLPAVQLLRHIRTMRREWAGRCPACGYDLRASPGDCPECGLAAVITSSR